MRSPLVLLRDTQPVTLAQTQRSVTLQKPQAGQSDALQIGPGDTLDLSAIANETIALVKLGNRLVVLFSDRSYVVVDGLYLQTGQFTPNVRIGLDAATTVDTQQFAAQFGVSADEEILTAAGISVGPRGSGGLNLAAAPPSSSLNPESLLTPETSGPSATFGTLTPAGNDASDPGFSSAQGGTIQQPGSQGSTAPGSTALTPATLSEPSGTPAQPGTPTGTGNPTGTGGTSNPDTPTDPGPVRNFRLDLDTTAPGTSYTGTLGSEAAPSSLRPEGQFASKGAPIGKFDPVAPFANYIEVTLGSGSALITSITASIGATKSGLRGVLRLLEGSTLPAGLKFSFDSETGTLNILIPAGLTGADARTLLSQLRFINTDRSFNLDMADRLISFTLTDSTGKTTSAVASVPIIADVVDTPGNDGHFTGGRFNDRILGLDGDDVLNGGDGDDYIDGGDGDDTINGGAGNDRLIGGSGDNTIRGGEGDNTISSGDGDDKITAGSGNDTISAGNGSNTIDAGDGDNTITTGSGDDKITTGSGNDVIHSGAGDDIIFSGAGNDTIGGGEGDDTIDAGPGDDRITGGPGADRITTGPGADTVVFDTDLSRIGRDTLVDFQSGTDVLEFSRSILGGSGLGPGTLDASRFTTGSHFLTGGGFTTPDQRFGFDPDTKTLFYDADGNGAAFNPIALAIFESGSVAAGDIRIT